MGQLPIDKNGVPRLAAGDIETKAEEVIEFFDPLVLQRPCATPLMVFLEETSRRFKVAIDFTRDLGESTQGHKIWGMFCFQPRRILVDRLLIGDARFSFILGHEFGHLVLHRDLIVKKKGYSDVDISDTAHDFVTGKKVLLTPRDWLEWQANRFAGAILMPRATVLDALLSVQRSLGVNHNVGRVFVERKPYSVVDFNRTVVELQSIYQVSRRNVEYRLDQLGLLIDQRNKNTEHMSELLREE
jgi:Zn-dependent peptidase ImmA (M78 family)